MGESVPLRDRPTARVIAEGPRPIRRIEIVGDGQVIAAQHDLPARCTVDFEDLPVCSWYYTRIVMEGTFPELPGNIAPAEGPWAWSSPIFAERA